MNMMIFKICFCTIDMCPIYQTRFNTAHQTILPLDTHLLKAAFFPIIHAVLV